jgi:hypothetical protein
MMKRQQQKRRAPKRMSKRQRARANDRVTRINSVFRRLARQDGKR